MIVKFQCAKCRKTVKVDSKHAGRHAKCPGCGAALRIPSLEQIHAAQAKRAQPAAAARVSTDTVSPNASQALSETPSDDFRRQAAQSKGDVQSNVSSAANQQKPATADNYAGIGQRFVALAVDQVIVLGLLMGVSFALGGVVAVLGVRDSPWLIPVVFANVIGTPWLYNAMLESSTQQATVGKWILRIRVTDFKGNRIGFGRATGRYFGKRLSGLILCIGYMMALFTQKKQALHDQLASTLVMQGRAESAGPTAAIEASGLAT